MRKINKYDKWGVTRDNTFELFLWDIPFKWNNFYNIGYRHLSLRFIYTYLVLQRIVQNYYHNILNVFYLLFDFPDQPIIKGWKADSIKNIIAGSSLMV